MKHLVPGTVMQGEDAGSVQAQLRAMFLAGGLTLAQVLYLTGLEAHTVQNWVRRGYVPPPIGKRYSLEQFCRIALFHALHDAISLEKLCDLLSAAECPGVGDDTVYFLYVAYVFGADTGTVPVPAPSPEYARRLEQILAIFRAAGEAQAWQSKVRQLISQFEKERGSL